MSARVRTFYLDDELVNALDEIATMAGVRRSDVVRAALHRYVVSPPPSPLRDYVGDDVGPAKKGPSVRSA